MTNTEPTTTLRLESLCKLASRMVIMEPWLASVAAVLLLLAPNPLIWLAIVMGSLPLLARLLLQGHPWRRTAFDFPLVLLAVGALLGSFASLSREDTLVRLGGLMASLLFFVLAREHASGERRLRILVLSALVGTVFASSVLLVLVGPFLRLEYLPPLASFVAAIDRWGLGAWFVDQDWLLQRYRFRASGVGALADVGLALALAAMIGLRGTLGRVMTAFAAVFFGVVLVVADNRGAIVAGAMTLALMATAWRRRLLPLIPLGLVVALAMIVLSPTDRGLSFKTLVQRFWFWENSIYLGQEVPLTGVGLGLESVQLVYRAYFLPSYPPFSHAHDVYLQGLLEYGIFGLAGLVGLGVATLWLVWRAPKAHDRWTTAGQLAGLGVALAMLTSGLTEIVMLTTLGGAIALAGLGLLAATTSASLLPTPSLAAHEQETRDSWGRTDMLSHTESVRAQGARRGRWLSRRQKVGIFGLVLIVSLLVATGTGGVIASRVLLSIGTTELNRGTLSETLGRSERTAALERAIGLLRLAGSLSPSDPAIQRNLALALAASDDDRRGRAAADRAKALTSADSRQDLFQLGRAYVSVSAWGEAIRAWQGASATPQLLQLGNRLIRARNFDQAENAFITAAQVDPKSRSAYQGVITVANLRGLSANETIDRLAPLLKIGSPTEYGARVAVARLYRENGQLRQAMAELTKVGETHSSLDLALESGRIFLRAGNPDLAEPALSRVAADEPYEPDNWVWLARARTRQGHPQEAIKAVREGLSKLDPSGQFGNRPHVYPRPPPSAPLR